MQVFTTLKLKHMFGQVAVALVDRMKLENGRTQAEQAEFFAKSLHHNWGVGDATCNSGLVLFLSKDDRQVLQSNLSIAFSFVTHSDRASVLPVIAVFRDIFSHLVFPADVPRS